MEEFLNEHYELIKARGLIRYETSTIDFFNKLTEEFYELKNEIYGNNSDKFVQETIDVICVCYHMLKHSGVNLKKELQKNIEKQKSRIK